MALRSPSDTSQKNAKSADWYEPPVQEKWTAQSNVPIPANVNSGQIYGQGGVVPYAAYFSGVAPVANYPSAASTGYAAAGYPVPTVQFTATTINAPITITNKIITGQVAIFSHDVIFEGCKFIADGQNGQIKLRSGYGGLIVRDCDMGGDGTTQVAYCIVADDIPVGKPIQILRNKVLNWSDGFQINGHGGALIADNYLAQATFFVGDHNDAISVNGGGWNMTIRHNTIELSLNETSCIGFFQDFPNPYINMTVENNLMSGGGYSLYCAASQATNTRYIDNRFSTKFYPDGGRWAPVRDFLPGPGNIWAGNVWHDGPNAGQLIP